MKKKLYYVVEKEIAGDNYDFVTGNKLISVYEMINNEPVPFTTIDATDEDSSQAKIQEYLDDNGHGDETFELIQL